MSALSLPPCRRGLVVLSVLALTLAASASAGPDPTPYPIYLDQRAGDDANDALTWETALKTLDEALARVEGDELVAAILLAQGHYHGDVVVERPNFALWGGFPTGGGGSVSDPVLFRTILDGTGNGPVITFRPGMAGALIGLTIQGGHATSQQVGGGINLENTTTAIFHCVVRNNVGCGAGGLFIDSRGLTDLPNVTAVDVDSNEARCDSGVPLAGGVTYLADAVAPLETVLDGLVIRRNRITVESPSMEPVGGLFAEGRLRIENVQVVDNQGAGAMLTSLESFLTEPDIHCTRCELRGNETHGLLLGSPSRVELSHLTLRDNGGAALRVEPVPGLDGRSVYQLRQSIAWSNAGGIFDDAGLGHDLLVEEGVIEGGWRGDPAVLDLEPVFVAGPFGRSYLAQVDAGDAVDSPGLNASTQDAPTLLVDMDCTRVDSIVDADLADHGMHYRIDWPGYVGPELIVGQAVEANALAEVDRAARLPWVAEPGLLSDTDRPLVFLKVVPAREPVLVRKDLATDSVVLDF
ncbi:MAG: hypothetical protein AAF533_04625 [Acidobacteriota bacterium]